MSLASALALHRQGNLREAERLYRDVLRQQPQHAEALHYLGILALQAGQPQAASELISQAVASDPHQPLAFLNLGFAQQQLGRKEAALLSFERALQLAPDHIDALNNRGNILLELERPADALLSFERSLQLRPGFPPALANRGNALRALKRTEEALQCYEQALAQGPRSPEMLANCANVLADLQLHYRAVQCYDEALRQLRDPELFRSRGDSLLALGRAEEARASYAETLRSQPENPEALFGTGLSLLMLGRPVDALIPLQKFCELRPDHPYALGYRLFARGRVCDWTDAEHDRAELVAAVLRGVRADVPFSLLAVSDSAEAQLLCARTFVAHRYPEQVARRPSRPPPRHERIRLAYVSGDLRNHVVSRLLIGVFEKHDRQRFEVNAISLRPADPHPFGRRVQAAFDRFTDVTRRDDGDVATMMREMEIDIAIDLTGFTDGQRTGIFARRCAPVQVNYIGFPGTMGASYIDYIIADEFLIPPSAQTHYAEKVAYLPGCFHPTDDSRPVPPAVTRASLGLPEAALVCCSLNNSYKYNGRMLDLWARLLQKAPGSVLWLLADDAATERNLRRHVAERGVSADRVLFSRRATYEENLARLSCADLLLDTLPFNAGATASDVLWAGVPLLTCSGDAFAARMAGSLLHAVGLPELVTTSLEEYEQRATELVTEPGRLGPLRQRLQAARSTSNLFNTERYCRDLESAFEIMWERAQRGETASPIGPGIDGPK